MLGVLPMLALLVAGFLPRRWLGRRVLAGAAAMVLAVAGVTLATLRGQDSDTSVHESNWESHGGHAFFLGVLAAEITLAALLGFLAYRPPGKAAIRAILLGSGVGTLVVTFLVLVALSN